MRSKASCAHFSVLLKTSGKETQHMFYIDYALTVISLWQPRMTLLSCFVSTNPLQNWPLPSFIKIEAYQRIHKVFDYNLSSNSPLLWETFRGDFSPAMGGCAHDEMLGKLMLFTCSGNCCALSGSQCLGRELISGSDLWQGTFWPMGWVGLNPGAWQKT